MFSSSAYLGVLLALLPLPSKLYASGQHGIMLELVPSVLSPRITVFSVFLVFLEPERDFQLMLRLYCVSLYLISVRLLYGRLIMNSSWISYPHFWHDDLVLVSSMDIERGIDMQRPLVLWGMCWWWWVPIWLGSWSGQKGSSSFSANCSEHYKVSQFEFLFTLVIFKLGCTGLKFLIGAVACLFVGVQIMFEYRYVLFWDRNDNTQCIISGKKKCDRACVGVVDQNRG